MSIFERHDTLDGWLSSSCNTLWQGKRHAVTNLVVPSPSGPLYPTVYIRRLSEKTQKPRTGRLDCVSGASCDPSRARMPVLADIFEHLLDVLRNRPTRGNHRLNHEPYVQNGIKISEHQVMYILFFTNNAPMSERSTSSTLYPRQS